jgi:hypothetical protein
MQFFKLVVAMTFGAILNGSLLETLRDEAA